MKTKEQIAAAVKTYRAALLGGGLEVTAKMLDDAIKTGDVALQDALVEVDRQVCDATAPRALRD